VSWEALLWTCYNTLKTHSLPQWKPLPATVALQLQLFLLAQCSPLCWQLLHVSLLRDKLYYKTSAHAEVVTLQLQLLNLAGTCPAGFFYFISTGYRCCDVQFSSSYCWFLVIVLHQEATRFGLFTLDQASQFFLEHTRTLSANLEAVGLQLQLFQLAHCSRLSVAGNCQTVYPNGRNLHPPQIGCFAAAALPACSVQPTQLAAALQFCC
jgi:hypothetical protein